MTQPLLSIVVPIGPKDWLHPELVRTLLKETGEELEIVLVPAPGVEPPPAFDTLSYRFRMVTSKVRGRAAQMNEGARAARGQWLWFLHADSCFEKCLLANLKATLRRTVGGRMFYFGLQFRHDGPQWVRVNEWGVGLRCRMFGLPFGDQGFCVDRRTFFQVGMYSTEVPYGEDHVFVWQLRRHDIPISALSDRLTTSARKYRQEGWLKTTGLHVWATWRQATEQWILTKKQRFMAGRP